MKVKGPAFEIKEFSFFETPKDSTSQFKTRVEVFDKYKEEEDVMMDESLKLYAKVRKLFEKDVSL